MLDIPASGSDFSLLWLISNTDWVTKFVMLMLLSASIISWGIAINKFVVIRKEIKKSDIFERIIFSKNNVANKLFDELKNQQQDSTLMRIFVAGIAKKKNKSSIDIMGLMQSQLSKEFLSIEKNIDWLATIGSTSPFIGLFGTVWGIMHSFHAISGAQTVTLTVIAPSISEALLATAMGLVAAIPSTVFYNKLTTMSNTFYESLTANLSQLNNLIFSIQANEKKGN